MSEHAKLIPDGHPKQSKVNFLASKWLAQRLVERIPEYADYAAHAGMDALMLHVNTAARGYRASEGNAANLALTLESLTTVRASGRVAALALEFARLRDEAEVLLAGEWIRKAALKPPFESDYARVEVRRAPVDGVGSDTRTKVGHAYRHSDLDARGVVMFVEVRPGARSTTSYELVPWERVGSVGPVLESDRLEVESRHRMLLVGFARARGEAADLPERIEWAFAEASFKEADPVGRRTLVAHLSDELAQSVSEGDDVTLKNILNRLAGISAAANKIEHSLLPMIDVPDDHSRLGSAP